MLVRNRKSVIKLPTQKSEAGQVTRRTATVKGSCCAFSSARVCYLQRSEPIRPSVEVGTWNRRKTVMLRGILFDVSILNTRKALGGTYHQRNGLTVTFISTDEWWKIKLPWINYMVFRLITANMGPLQSGKICANGNDR